MPDLSSFVYVVFEEYTDLERQKSKEYIRGNEQLLQDDCKEIRNIIQHYFGIIDFFSYENARYIYDKNNVLGLLFPFSTLDREYPGVATNLLAQFDSHGFIEAADIDDSTHTENVSFLFHDVSQDMLGRMAIRQHLGENVVLLSCNALLPNTSPVHCMIMPEGEPCDIVVCEDIKGLHKWFSEKRKHKRQYKYNPKHGNSTHPSQYYTDASGNSKKAAQLESSDTDAQKLLDLAIGNSQYSTLWFWDDSVEKYIYFKYQGKNLYNEYHCYHLSPGEPDFDEIDRAKVKTINPMANP